MFFFHKELHNFSWKKVLKLQSKLKLFFQKKINPNQVIFKSFVNF